MAEQLADPTRPAGSQLYPHGNHASPAKAQWILTSTLIANGRRNAVINGQLVSVGQTIQQAKVVAIRPNEAELLIKGKRILIKMLSKDIKDFSSFADK